MLRMCAVVVCGLLSVMLLVGCSKKKAEPRPGAAGQGEELADSTRLDSANKSDFEAPPSQDSTAPRPRRGYR